MISKKMNREINYLLLSNYLIIRSGIEITTSSGNSNHRIYNNDNNNDDNQSRRTTTFSIPSGQQEQECLLSPFAKRILIVDTDITFTFKTALEAENNNNKNNNKIFLKAYTYNDPLEALSQFKPNFYDLLLVDINMPKMDGFELVAKNIRTRCKC